jgi:GT2 family glycosyltransferase
MQKVSIVIPNYNGKKLLEKNLPKVIVVAVGAEIIVVDDASTDDSVAFLKSANWRKKVKIVVHQKNLRFSAACNSGVKKARGEIVILLNNDVVPKKGFLKPLLANFKKKNVFSVGCKEIETKNGKKIISGRNGAEFKRGFLVHWRSGDQNKKDTFWTFGGSMAVNRKKYLEIGGMDTIYKPAYWEDIDLCFRARKKGWKILFEPKAIVYHQHETTNIKELGKVKMEIAAYKNQILFVWKNIRKRQLAQHFLWLPYHLIFTTIRSRGLFFLGFLWALVQLREIFEL